jgi:hypothetical protein
MQDAIIRLKLYISTFLDFRHIAALPGRAIDRAGAKNNKLLKRKCELVGGIRNGRKGLC